MANEDPFRRQVDQLLAEARQLDDSSEQVVAETADRLRGLNYAPPVITPINTFLALRRDSLLGEIERILALPDAEACALAPDDSRKCEDLRIQFISVLLFYYKQLGELRRGNPEAWDEIDELYVHD